MEAWATAERRVSLRVKLFPRFFHLSLDRSHRGYTSGRGVSFPLPLQRLSHRLSCPASMSPLFYSSLGLFGQARMMDPSLGRTSHGSPHSRHSPSWYVILCRTQWDHVWCNYLKTLFGPSSLLPDISRTISRFVLCSLAFIKPVKADNRLGTKYPDSVRFVRYENTKDEGPNHVFH